VNVSSLRTSSDGQPFGLTHFSSRRARRSAGPGIGIVDTAARIIVTTDRDFRGLRATTAANLTIVSV
jgi:hypothetical protein